MSLFQGIDWHALGKKKVPPPFKPVIENELDVSNFAEEFTEMIPIDSPAAVPKNTDKVFRVSIDFTFYIFF